MVGVSQLGYLGIEASNLDAWEDFATKVLGLALVDRREGGAFSLRMDGYRQRFFVEPGPLDDVSVIGWQVDDEAALAAIAARVRAVGIEVREGGEVEARARRVARLVRFADPNGIPTEVFCGPERSDEAFKSPVLLSHFVAEELGLGHVVIAARDKQESVRFYSEVLGFRASDRIVCEIHGYPVDIDFFHANARHHSVAIGDRQRKRIHHFMLEVRAMDDVGLAFDRCLRSGVKIMQTLGRHPNDQMFSFYAKTPSGFQFELGWGGREIDDASWKPTVYDRVSEWGHHPPVMFSAEKGKSS